MVNYNPIDESYIDEKDLFFMAGNIVFNTYLKEVNANKVDKETIKTRILEVYTILKETSELI